MFVNERKSFLMRSKEVGDLCLHGRKRWWPDVLRVGVTGESPWCTFHSQVNLGGLEMSPSVPHLLTETVF